MCKFKRNPRWILPILFFSKQDCFSFDMLVLLLIYFSNYLLWLQFWRKKTRSLKGSGLQRSGIMKDISMHLDVQHSNWKLLREFTTQKNVIIMGWVVEGCDNAQKRYLYHIFSWILKISGENENTRFLAEVGIEKWETYNAPPQSCPIPQRVCDK